MATDKNDVVHFLAPSEIVYARAQRKTCTIHTTGGGEIAARMSISDFLARAGAGFSTVHRSYAMNNAYIARVQKSHVVMADGTQIPIPERRYKEIREALTELFDTQADQHFRARKSSVFVP